MKKLLYAIVLLVFSGLFSACQKDVDLNLVDGKTPDQRTREYMDNVREILSSSPHGWAGYLTIPNNGLSFTYYMKFTENGRVQMYSDFNGDAMITPRESSYALRNTSIPSLIFDSFNYIHMPADPSGEVSGGATPIGLYADFEFGIQYVSTDTIVLEGYLRSNVLTLVRINAEDREAVDNGGFADMVDKLQNYFLNNGNSYISVTLDNGQQRRIGFKYAHNTRQLFYVVSEPDGKVSYASATFNYSVTGMEILTDRLAYSGLLFKSFRFSENGNMYVVDQEGNEYEFNQSATSVAPFAAVFGSGKVFTTLRIPGEVLPEGVNSEFNDIYNGMVTRFNGTSRTIVFVELILASNNTGFVLVRYTTGTNFNAIARFNYSIDSDNVLTISNWNSSAAVANGNWTSRATQIGNFATWFQDQGPFKLDWVPGLYDVLGGLIPVNNPNNFFYGIVRETPQESVAQYL